MSAIQTRGSKMRKRFKLPAVKWPSLLSAPGFALGVLTLLTVFTLAPDLVSPHSAIALDVKARLVGPSLTHPFGTDEGGRDLLSRIIFGTRYSVGSAVAIVIGAAAFGLAYGSVAGMAPRQVDNVMMRVVDVFMGFPALVLSLTISAAVGRGLGGVIISLLLIWWPSYARYVRSEVQRLRALPHVEGAISLGAPNLLLLRRHILPFLIQGINVRISTDIGYALVAVTALSFLGLGVQSPTPEWGLLIRDSRTYFGTAWWYLVFPGMMIMITSTAFSIVGDSLASQSRSRTV